MDLNCAYEMCLCSFFLYKSIYFVFIAGKMPSYAANTDSVWVEEWSKWKTYQMNHMKINSNQIRSAMGRSTENETHISRSVACVDVICTVCTVCSMWWNVQSVSILYFAFKLYYIAFVLNMWYNVHVRMRMALIFTTCSHDKHTL